ncbi:MAG: hypothetical protein WC760_13085 [Bacteroidia bacterium]|jgi:hypothetical protein
MQIRWLILAFLPLLATAQDTLLPFRVQMLNLQQTCSPSSQFDHGRNIISLNGQFDYSAYSTTSFIQSQRLQLGYSTRLKQHALALNGDSYSTSTYKNQFLNIQYAYTFRFKNKIFGKQLAFIPGIGYTYHRNVIQFDKVLFYDMISQGQGFGATSKELGPASVLTYSTFQLSLLLRSEKFYIQLFTTNLTNLNPSFYPFNQYSTHIITTVSMENRVHAAAKLIQHKQFDLWLNGHLQSISQASAGATVTCFKNLMLSYNQYFRISEKEFPANTSELSIGFYTKHLRTFFRYKNNTNPFIPYFFYGKFSIGLSAAIGKQ